MRVTTEPSLFKMQCPGRLMPWGEGIRMLEEQEPPQVPELSVVLKLQATVFRDSGTSCPQTCTLSPDAAIPTAAGVHPPGTQARAHSQHPNRYFWSPTGHTPRDTPPLDPPAHVPPGPPQGCGKESLPGKETQTQTLGSWPYASAYRCSQRPT